MHYITKHFASLWISFRLSYNTTYDFRCLYIKDCTLDHYYNVHVFKYSMIFNKASVFTESPPLFSGFTIISPFFNFSIESTFSQEFTTSVLSTSSMDSLLNQLYPQLFQLKHCYHQCLLFQWQQWCLPSQHPLCHRKAHHHCLCHLFLYHLWSLHLLQQCMQQSLLSHLFPCLQLVQQCI